uniref:Helicase C-terminal domain-containing protein n=1 Tax=Leersia perrieri TaxID=77586 RepID=A0A0D9VIY5_9ORYZ
MEARPDRNEDVLVEIKEEPIDTEDDDETEEEESWEDEDGTGDDDSDNSFSEEENGDESAPEEDEPDEPCDEPLEPREKLPSRQRWVKRDRGEQEQLIGKRKFEGLYLSEQADTSHSQWQAIRGRTRSNFKHRMIDKKLLRRGTFSKPYCIDVSESSSDSEEDVPGQPVYNEDCEDDSGSDCNEKKRAVKKRRWTRTQNANSDTEDDKAFECDDVREGSGSRRRLNGASHQQASREGYVGNNGPKAGSKTVEINGQSGVSLKKNAQVVRRDQHKYDHLLDAMFNEIESHQYEPVPADQIHNRLPLVFAFGDDDELKDNAKHNELQDEDELWKEFDFALESINVCSHTCNEGENNDEQEIPGDKATLCSRGKHELIIDDQIGLRCKHCHFVDLEIRYVLPSMSKYYNEKEIKKDNELDLFFDDILTSTGYEGERDFGGHKTGLVWDLVPGVREDMFPHQREGFEFMWRKLAGETSIEQLKHAANTIEGGCVISHAPGTGKTRLAITFVQSYIELYPQCCPVIIAPKGMLATWEQEFRKWKVKVPFHVLNSNEINWNEDKTIKGLATMDENLAQSLARNKLDRSFRRKLKLASWRKGSSIIGVSYSLFRKLASHEGIDGLMVKDLLLERPDLLVLDEGHTPRNKKSLIWKLLEKVRTEKRIILSGTPFQNNFLELYNIVYLIRPKFARDFASKSFKKKGFASRTSRSRDMMVEDFWTSLTLNNITEENIDEIRKLLVPIVHIHNGDILQKSLPGLRESVVILNPLPRQKEIITAMENAVAMGTLDAEYKISLASIHPSLITSAKLTEKETSSVDVSLLKKLRRDPREGVKTRFVLEIVRLCEAMKERVLVFSQYLEPLSLIMGQLSKMFNWKEGKEILLMSGNVLAKNREALMDAFNDMKSDAKVMLASTKACCEGITLIGASRVVLLDVVWNPSVGRQAIGRAYRIGQEKIVYTYNLITEGTKEKDKYDRQAKKDHMSKLLFSKELQPAGFNLSQEVIFNDKILEAMTSHGDLKDMFVKILRSH